MRRMAPWLLALLLALPGGLPAQPAAPESRTFTNPPDSVWFAAQKVLTGLGWKIEETDPATGRMVTDSRAVDFKDFVVYGQGSRHRLRLTVTAAGEGRTAVTVERELYREERLLWMSSRKPLETSDRSVENALLDGVQDALAAVVAPSAPPPADARPAPTSGLSMYKVTYRVKGTAGRVLLTYRNSQGGTEQSNVPLPWQMSFDARGGSFLYIAAQNQDATGSVTCEILLEEETRTTSTSSGAYVIAECTNAAERP